MKLIYAIKKRFEDLSGGGIAYFTYKILYLLSNKSIKSSKWYYDLAFKYNFMKCDLITAYSFRLKQMIMYELNKCPEYKDSAKNYLDIVNDKEFLDLLNLKIKDRDYLNNRARPIGIKKRKDEAVSSVLCLGPAYDGSIDIDFTHYDYIVLNKPPLTECFDIPPEKIIVLLNNQWSTGKYKESSMEWIEKNQFFRVYSPTDFLLDNKKIYPFLLNVDYLSASPMGLQRMLCLLLEDLNIRSVDLEGYDFQLSPKPYSNWYPSGLEFFHGSFYKGWLITNIKHDFMFNFLFVKHLKKRFEGRISGSVDVYLDMPIAEVISLFEKKIE